MAVLDGRSSPSSDQESEISDILDLKNDEGWEDVEPDVESLAFVSFFDSEIFTDLSSLLDYMREKWDFDLRRVRRELGLDFFETMKLVNYVRSEVSSGNQSPDVSSKLPFADDRYLRPSLAEDAVLYSLGDLENTEHGDGQSSGGEPDDSKACERILELEEQLRQAKQTIDDLRLQLTDHSDIHETMLKDTARTDAYRDFIYSNKQAFKDKVVLDVGCGTAILSMMCAKAGAKRVLAVDNSEIIHKARANVFLNGLQDTVTCIHGKVEEIELPVDKVDVIVSEWMGYALLYEAMLDSVIWARDRWLVPGGLMVPCDMYLCIAPLADSNLYMDKISFWNDVYGFQMMPMQEGIFEDVLLMDCQESTIPSRIKDKRRPHFLHLDLYTAGLADLAFSKLPFSVELSRDVDALDGFVIWFDSVFGREERSETVNELSTGPDAPYTHWMQTVAMIDHLERKAASLGRGHIVRGFVSYERPQQNQRQLKITVSWTTERPDTSDTADTAHPEIGKQSWKLE